MRCVCDATSSHARCGDGAGSVTHCETALCVVVCKILLRTVYLESRPFRCGIFYTFVLVQCIYVILNNFVVEEIKMGEIFRSSGGNGELKYNNNNVLVEVEKGISRSAVATAKVAVSRTILQIRRFGSGKDIMLPRNQWPLGRILSVKSDYSGLVRSVLVRIPKSRNASLSDFATSDIERPISKLVLLRWSV